MEKNFYKTFQMKRNIHGHGYPGLCSGIKVASLKERAGTLVFQLHHTINSCGVYLQPLL